VLRLTQRVGSTTLALLLGLGAFAPHAPAQCLPDGLGFAPCCGPASVTLPTFPAFSSLPTQFICFDSCQSALNVPYCVDIGQPNPVLISNVPVCGAYHIRFKFKTCGTTTFLWKGLVNAYYSRNWQETPVVGAPPITIWRFVVNGDFLPTPSLPNNPLQRPACLNNFTRVYWSGYIDYVLDCTTNTWQVAFNLNHECDGIHHISGTARPAPSSGLHPTRSFSFVGPGTGFVVSSTGTATGNGPISQEAVRWNNWGNAPAICTLEEPATGTFQSSNAFCMCVSGGNQYVSTNVSANGVCGSSVTRSPIYGFYQERIGSWTNASAYPGTQDLLFDFGYLAYANACNGIFTQEWFEGGETLGGYTAFDFTGVALGTQFEDLASASLSMTNQATRIGAPHVSYYMLNFNQP
jgi:hypothetical protein